MIDTIWKTFTQVLSGRFYRTGDVKADLPEELCLCKWSITSPWVICQERALQVWEQHPSCCSASCIIYQMFRKARALGMEQGEQSHYARVNQLSAECVSLQLPQVPSPWIIMLHTFRSPDPNSWRWKSQCNGRKHVDSFNWSLKWNPRNDLLADGFEAFNLAELGSIW